MIKALIFDFDGLLVDTETTEYLSFQQLGQQVGIELPIALWHSWVGSINGRVQALQYVAQQLGNTSDQHSKQLEANFLAIFEENIAKQQLLPGARQLIEQAKSYDLKVAIASSSDYQWVSGFLRRFDLLAMFDHIQTRDDVTHVKPHPEIYIKAMERLNVLPHEAIAFEDSYVGSQAAKAAGLICLVVPNLVTRKLNFSHADQVLASLRDANLEKLLRLYGNLEEGHF